MPKISKTIRFALEGFFVKKKFTLEKKGSIIDFTLIKCFSKYFYPHLEDSLTEPLAKFNELQIFPHNTATQTEDVNRHLHTFELTWKAGRSVKIHYVHK